MQIQAIKPSDEFNKALALVQQVHQNHLNQDIQPAPKVVTFSAPTPNPQSQESATNKRKAQDAQIQGEEPAAKKIKQNN